jgi:hypothetical protein
MSRDDKQDYLSAYFMLESLTAAAELAQIHWAGACKYAVLDREIKRAREFLDQHPIDQD